MENNLINTPLEQYLKKEIIDDFTIDIAIEDDLQKKPEPFLWKKINSFEFPKDRWLVDNIFPKEGISVLSSITGEGKSLVLMHLAKCLVEGSPWFGEGGFKTKKSRVLYINLEMSVSEIQRRGRKIGFDSDCEDLFILNEDDFNLNINNMNYDDVKYKWLLNFIYKNKINVVIIDTLRACVGGIKEEKAEEIRKFFQKFQVLKNSGISIIFAEHNRKPSHFEGKKPKKEQLLGSTDKTANLEVLLMMCRDEKTDYIEFYQRKNRLGKEAPPFAVKMEDVYDENWENDSLVFSHMGTIEDDDSKKEEGKRLILDLLSDKEHKHTKTIINALNKQVGTKNIRQALRELVNTEAIDFYRDGREHCYFIPEDENSPENPIEDTKNSIFDDS